MLKPAWTMAIILVSASLGMLVDWRTPGIDRYGRDWLMRARGTVPAPDDIAIVAIDEPSIARFGRFPWPRTVIATTIDALTAAQPKVIALDVLFTDPTTPEEDAALTNSIHKAGNVVVAAQLIEPSTWLLPLPSIQQTAAAVGHVNVLTESEGVARELLVRAADDSGRSYRAMPLEAVRVAEGTPERAVLDGRAEILLGRRSIPVEVSAAPVVIGRTKGTLEVLRAARINIDYIGPSGSFASKTYSIADVLDGKIAASRFAGRYVLIGATAAALGDRLSSPFMHRADVRGDQHGSPMPGVEVLANAINTILRSRFFSETPDWLTFLLIAVIAALTLGLLGLAHGRWEGARQIAILSGVGALIILASYLAFDHLLVYPPMTPGLVSFASAGMLGLLRRMLVTSATLDAGLAKLAEAENKLAPMAAPDAAAESIARLTGAAGAAVFAVDPEGVYHRLASYGVALIRESSGAFALPADQQDLYQIRVEKLTRIPEAAGSHHNGEGFGLLVLACSANHPPTSESIRLALAIAASCIETSRAEIQRTEWWPRDLESKAHRLSELNAQLLDRARFVDHALRSVEDGLIMAGPDGSITFVNRGAARILESKPEALTGANLLQRVADEPDGNETLERLLIDRVKVEREITVRGARPRQCILRISAVSAREDGSGPVLGLVASLSDITRQHELYQTKNDVIALVSHEMRTPLTAIQGMTELLATYDLDTERRREMNLAINGEVKRLTRMITEYLDITRLEAGATKLRRSPVRVDQLIERTLLMLEPVAAQRRIGLVRRIGKDVPPLLADSDLVTRAVDNLVSNAIKYSPPGKEVTVSARSGNGSVLIEVADQGYGIPPEDMERIFQKFYRVPRVQDADTPGTGLGLAFVKEIAELHGGSVIARSEVNLGSVFTLRIPVDILH